MGPRRGVAQGVGCEVDHDPLQQRGVGVDVGQAVRHLDLHRPPGQPELVQGVRNDVVETGLAGEDAEHAGLQPAHVQQVVDEPGEPVHGLVGRGQQLRLFVRRPGDVPAAQARDGRPGRGQR